MSPKFNYECIAETTTDGGVKLSKFKSHNSSLTICIAEVNGPLVGGYFTFATEAFDDDGLPHTLEHLVFLGSEKYPYKGVLDMVANRCLAQGTNAWTDTDHTCYTVSTAGDEGFLNLLPMYLDHLLFPTLTDSAYITEVHHINGEGEDAGVVYCEMQARENSGESRCHRAMLCSMYPGRCGYKSETGGLTKNLRESTSNEKVRAYHKEFYRPENLCIIITGQVEAEKVFQALVPIEEKLLNKDERCPFTRPWQSPVPPLPESVTLNIEYPADEAEYGIVIAAWRGPLADDYYNLISVQILMDYFTDTSVAPICRDFIEIEEPLCNQVDYTVIENSVSCIYLYFSSVPVEKLSELKEKLLELLQNVADGTEAIDMERMKTLIKKKKLHILSSMESNPHEHLASCLIGDFLYGSTLEDLDHRVREIPAIDKLFEKDTGFWVDLLNTYFANGKYVIVLGMPSPELSKKMTKEEQDRTRAQQEKLGPDGLKEKAKALKKAIAVNEVAFPNELLSSVPIPSVRSIKFHPIKRTSNLKDTKDDDIKFAIEKMPCRFELDVIQTNFVRSCVLMDTSHLPLESRMYLPLFIELLDECAISRNNEIIQYQDVVKQLAEDTVSISASLGMNYSRFFCSTFAQVICLELMVEEEKYERSIEWVREILFQIVFEPSRIKSAANKMITDVSSVKRSASGIAKTMMKNMCFSSDSNHWSSSVLRQHCFLTELVQRLESNPSEVVEKLNEIRESVTKPEFMTVHLALNLDSIQQKVELERAWIEQLIPSTIAPKIMRNNVKKCFEFLNPIAEDSVKGLITGLGSVESSYLMQSTPCLQSRLHPDYAPLLVLNNYLTQLEGPMWKKIRGTGLAYSFWINAHPDTGTLNFVLVKSTHLVKAYKEAVDIVESYLNGTSKWDMELLESARSSLVFSKIETIKTVADVVEASLLAYFTDANSDMAADLKELLDKISKVTTTDMERVGMQYLKPLFNPQMSRCAITCNPGKVKEITEGFQKMCRCLTEVPSLDDCFMAKY